ncbi:hypothetical protein [uncultured Psychromonas sp.]|uniref:hypothetical protein n=1 Tax=uncultured Psychromonas sp. TaxID=173974 RepID=UPI00262F4712|nr:hypothetical protein [uncultured Psychromonas sp.]
MADNWNKSNFTSVKKSLISAISCEYRQSLFDVLAPHVGNEKAFIILKGADTKAQRNCNTLRIGDLTE